MNGPFLSVKSGIRVGRPIDPDGNVRAR